MQSENWKPWRLAHKTNEGRRRFWADHVLEMVGEPGQEPEPEPEPSTVTRWRPLLKPSFWTFIFADKNFPFAYFERKLGLAKMIHEYGNWVVSDYLLKTATKTAGAVTKPISFVSHLLGWNESAISSPKN